MLEYECYRAVIVVEKSATCVLMHWFSFSWIVLLAVFVGCLGCFSLYSLRPIWQFDSKCTFHPLLDVPLLNQAFGAHVSRPRPGDTGSKNSDLELNDELSEIQLSEVSTSFCACTGVHNFLSAGIVATLA